jgi:general nucleoside transport system permease protein
MSESSNALPEPKFSIERIFRQFLKAISAPLLAILTAFILGALVIWVTSGSLLSVFQAYQGLINGAFFATRGLSESIVATIPYIFLSLAVAVGFKSGLFNIGVEGQFDIGAIVGAFVGQAFHGLPAIIHLPLTLACAALGGAIWAGIPGYLKARTGAHEVITTIMMNYVSFRLTEYLVSGPIKDPNSSAVQTPASAQSAWVWSLSSIPQRLQDPLNALGTAIFLAALAYLFARWMIGRTSLNTRLNRPSQKKLAMWGFTVIVALFTFFVLPPLSKVFWPFNDPYDRLHIGLIFALLASILVWWMLWKTTLGFELRMVGANPNAARYSGINITRNVVVAMAISGAFAGFAGAIEVLGVSSCHCQQVFYVSGYGFDAIAIALLAKNNPFGILAASFLFGAMRNGSDLMELNSGVSKYIISLIQALALLFVSAPAIINSIYRRRGGKKKTSEAALNPEGEVKS